MVRIIIKGGIWKNIEDEILKAAVMKYGLNQWARISSLLVGKTAAQCKARWKEWLDPNIKKTDWSREEEEKLLHLAKIMPNQWRTIAPLVGRTAAQCLEHYEKLLDRAQGKDEMDMADDPRRLRPGEIDPLPEVKPARPDAVDLDEDEKEMLNEARARLANTKGKKAKRKAREKQLEEARRLAILQKRREMRAAGIHLREMRIKMGGSINYNREVAFEQQPPPGVYDVSGEPLPPPKPFRPMRLDELEGPRRAEEEARARKEDAQRAKRRKEMDMPGVILQASALDEGRKRVQLHLPAPQMSEADLEQVVRTGVVGQIEGAGVPFATPLRGLPAATPAVGGMTPGRTPMRTPMAGDTIMAEARNILSLQTQATPLAGGENAPLSDTDFSGVAPKSKVAATPNALLTPLRSGAAGQTIGLTPRGTPLRDELGLNAADAAAAAERAQQAALRSRLKQGLSALPKPSNEYSIEAPAVEEDEAQREAGGEEEMELDQADVDAARAGRLSAQAAERLKLRSQALQRGLPRPLAVPDTLSDLGDTSEAAALVRAEMLALLQYEAQAYPVQGAAPGGTAPPPRDRLTVDELAQARLLIAEEAGPVEPTALAALHGAHQAALQHGVWSSSRHELVNVSTAPARDAVAALRDQFELLRAAASSELKRATKAEQKLGVLLGGYTARNSTVARKCDQLLIDLSLARADLATYKLLQEQERRALPARLEALRADVAAARARDNELQRQYANLMLRREDALRGVSQHQQ